MLTISSLVKSSRHLDQRRSTMLGQHVALFRCPAGKCHTKWYEAGQSLSQVQPHLLQFPGCFQSLHVIIWAAFCNRPFYSWSSCLHELLLLRHQENKRNSVHGWIWNDFHLYLGFSPPKDRKQSKVSYGKWRHYILCNRTDESLFRTRKMVTMVSTMGLSIKSIYVHWKTLSSLCAPNIFSRSLIFSVLYPNREPVNCKVATAILTIYLKWKLQRSHLGKSKSNQASRNRKNETLTETLKKPHNIGQNKKQQDGKPRPSSVLWHSLFWHSVLFPQKARGTVQP